MDFKHSGPRPPDNCPASYGASKLTFRGPARDLSGGYVACLGGTQTYGKSVDRPWPAILEDIIGIACVNLGLPNAGPDVILKDEGLVALASGGRAAVLQIPCAMNLSNAYYTVHPRRNDRFLVSTGRLRRLYPEVDFTEFHFTRHLMRRLSGLSSDRFAKVRRELQDVWVTRMQEVLTRIETPVVLLWIANHPPGAGTGTADVTDDPAFVSRAMIQAICPRAAGLVEVVIDPAAPAKGQDESRVSAMAYNAAATRPGSTMLMPSEPGPPAHDKVARALCRALQDILAR